MASNPSRPKQGDFKAYRENYPGLWGKTKLYEKLNAGLIKAKKDGKKLILDFDSIDEHIASLPDYNPQDQAA